MADQLDFPVRPELEVCWAVETPHNWRDLLVVCGAFYILTNSDYAPPLGLLEDHVTDVIDDCTAKFGSVLMFVGGNLNRLDLINRVTGIPV